MLTTLQAGLAAYFLALEKKKFAWDPLGYPDQGQRFCQKLKQHIIDHHYRRYPMEEILQDGALEPGQSLPFPLPADVPVAYNGARGPQNSKFIILFSGDYRYVEIC